MTDWESEVRWRRLQRIDDSTPHRELRRWRRRFWLSLAANFLLFMLLLRACR